MELCGMNLIVVLIGIAVIIFLILSFLVIRYYNLQRQKALKQLGESLNFTFFEKGDPSILDAMSGFHLFSQGYARRITNVLAGNFNDIPVTVMDYQYTTGSGKSSHTWNQTVIAFDSEKLSLPVFVLRPENLFDKIGSAFGQKDINFDTAPLFSKKYLLRANDDSAIRMLFKEWVLSYFEQHPGLSAEGDGRKLIYYRIAKPVVPTKIEAFLQEGYEIFGLFKK
jgi:hypothetical protein